MPSGFFLTFEGLDGSGKTTQLRRLTDSLTAEGYPVVCLRQPGSTALGDRLRSVLLDSRSEAALGPIAPLAELALMFADRAQAIAEVIKPALAQGHVVLCDRFTDSSEAYQEAVVSSARLQSSPCTQLSAATSSPISRSFFCRRFRLLSPAPAAVTGAAHNSPALSRPDENRFERESDAFYTRIHETYQAIAARESDRVVALTGDYGIEDIQKLSIVS